MLYCHECGEEVAEIDSFCPFCGISLQNNTVQSSETSDDDSQANTIAVSTAEISEMLDNEAEKVEQSSAEIEPEPVKIRERLIDTSPVIRSDDKAEITSDVKDDVKVDVDHFQESETSTDQTTDSEPSSSEPETPEFKSSEPETPKDATIDTPPQTESTDLALGNSENEVSELTRETKENYFPPDTIEPQNLQSENITLETPVSEVFESQTESSMMSYEETEIKEKTTVEETDVELEKDSTTEAQIQDEVVGIPETIEEITKTQEQDAVEELSEVSKEIEQSVVEDSTNVSLQDDLNEPILTEDKLNEPILPPDVELEKDDEKSEFDSVKIRHDKDDVASEPEISSGFSEQPIEKQPESVMEDVTLIDSSPDVEPVQESTTPSDDLEQNQPIVHSHTTPNIGVGDTDGKKSQLKPLDEGTVLNDRYEIIRKIGGGGMGAVYLASDKNLGGVLRAVKEMVQSYIEEEQQEKAINDFKRESLLLTSLEHQSIPTIYDYFYDEKEGRFYLVMKYINGGDLSSRLRSAPDGRIEEETVTEWSIQVADVLDYLHKRQPPIVYRDLKPANIMIDGNSGRVMLIDFGIARWINKEEKGVTAVGTMGYAPPELFSGKVEPSSDIYSLGSTMFHLLTGSDPQSNPLLIFDFQKNPRPRQINPQISDQMERILMQMVEYNAEKRFSTTEDLRQALIEHFEFLKKGKVSFGIKETPKPVSLTEEQVFCGFCGKKIVASDMFCAFCGSKQPLAQKGVHGEDYASVPLTAKLFIIGTNELESPSYLIEKDENLVGRRDPMSNIFPEVDLSKFDPQTKISRRHARIWRDGNNYMVEDLGSSNGTVLMPVVSETKRLAPHNPHILTNGDKIRLGDTTLHFVIG